MQKQYIDHLETLWRQLGEEYLIRGLVLYRRTNGLEIFVEDGELDEPFVKIEIWEESRSVPALMSRLPKGPTLGQRIDALIDQVRSISCGTSTENSNPAPNVAAMCTSGR